MHICVYDSGVGGHFVGRDLNLANIHYFTDSANYPYGTKSQKDLSSIIRANLKAIDSKSYDYLVLACNTASIAIENEPAISKNIKTKILKITDWLDLINPIELSGNLCIIGTSFVVNSGYYPAKFKKMGINNKITNLDSQALINAIEKNDTNTTDKEINKLESFIQKTQTDTLILACTHFSAIREELKQRINCQIVDPSLIIAQYLTSQNK